MQLKSKSAVAFAATVAVGVLPAAGASAASFHGVVVHENGRAHSFVLAGPGGRLTAIHARHLPVVGRIASVAVRRLRNGTWVAQHLLTRPASARVQIRGTVTYTNLRRRTFVLSVRGASLLVHEPTRLRHNLRVAASDAGLRDGEVVTVEGDLAGPSVDASSIHVSGEESSGINLEGTVQVIDPVSRTLTVSADDDDQSGAVVTVEVPSWFDLGAFTTGEPVELTVSRNPDGTYTLAQSSDDSSASAADNLDDMQGDDHGGDHANAARECAAQEADLGFPATHGGETFTQFYERNADDADNAFGRCVNLTAHQLDGPSGGDGSETQQSASEGSGSVQSGSGQSATEVSASHNGSDG